MTYPRPPTRRSRRPFPDYAQRAPADVVWDPFVGSGSELIEVALLAKGPRGGPALFGSDMATEALATTAQNAAAAGIALQLQQSDALGPPPPGLTRIVTNPPMGRRVRRGEVTELLARFAEHAARVLPPNGQLAWIAPQPQRTSPILTAGGMTLERAHTIDMNGFWASPRTLDQTLLTPMPIS